jgi:hypothetical protein
MNKKNNPKKIGNCIKFGVFKNKNIFVIILKIERRKYYDLKRRNFPI